MRCTAYKLDGVGPIDIRPSTDKLHQFVQKKKKKRKKKLDGVGHVDNRPSTDDLHYFVKKKDQLKHGLHRLDHRLHRLDHGRQGNKKVNFPQMQPIILVHS